MNARPHATPIAPHRGDGPPHGHAQLLAQARDTADAVARDREGPSPDTARALVQVFDGGHIPTSVPRVFLAYPVEVDMEDREGSTPTFTPDTSQPMPVVVINQPAVAGDILPAHAIAGRWVAEKGGVKKPCPCVACAGTSAFTFPLNDLVLTFDPPMQGCVPNAVAIPSVALAWNQNQSPSASWSSGGTLAAQNVSFTIKCPAGKSNPVLTMTDLRTGQPYAMAYTGGAGSPLSLNYSWPAGVPDSNCVSTLNVANRQPPPRNNYCVQFIVLCGPALTGFGNGLLGATVTVTNTSGFVGTCTTPKPGPPFGSCTIALPGSGSYTVKVTHPDYATFSQQMDIRACQVLIRMDPKTQLGGDGALCCGGTGSPAANGRPFAIPLNLTLTAAGQTVPFAQGATGSWAATILYDAADAAFVRQCEFNNVFARPGQPGKVAFTVTMQCTDNVNQHLPSFQAPYPSGQLLVQATWGQVAYNKAQQWWLCDQPLNCVSGTAPFAHNPNCNPAGGVGGYHAICSEGGPPFGLPNCTTAANMGCSMIIYDPTNPSSADGGLATLVSPPTTYGPSFAWSGRLACNSCTVPATDGTSITCASPPLDVTITA